MTQAYGNRIFITGGGGYVGSALVPSLLHKGYEVTVLDLMLYGDDVLPNHERLNLIKGDIRDESLVSESVADHDAVIHLACISNDPSFDLNPSLGKSINLDAFEPLVVAARDGGVRRFIYASSSSVYGIKETPDVTEEMPLDPLTDYSRFKAACEEILRRHQSDDFTTVTIRPATVCGYAPRLRLDLTVNILTNLAVNKGAITVFGGEQKRPNIHMADMVHLYELLLELPSEAIAGKVFNAGYQNQRVREIAEIVRDVVGDQVEIVTTSTDDNRSYHISSRKIRDELGFEATHSIRDAVLGLRTAFDKGLVPNALTDDVYYNVKRMKRINLQ
jgi:nucleoside-diphosphate-sugar epimerase